MCARKQLTAQYQLPNTQLLLILLSESNAISAKSTFICYLANIELKPYVCYSDFLIIFFLIKTP